MVSPRASQIGVLVMSLLLLLWLMDVQVLTGWYTRRPVKSSNSLAMSQLISSLNVSHLVKSLNKSQLSEISQLLRDMDVSCAKADILRDGSRSPTSPTRRQVLLVTFGRSGSSFTSALIQGHPDVFYFSEPLAGLAVLYWQRIVRRNQIDVYRWGEDKKKESLPQIEEVLMHCGSRNGSLVSNGQDRRSNDTKELIKCFRKNIPGVSHMRCYFQTLRRCLSRRLTFAKTIRFRLAWTEELLSRIPTLKVLYLVRDPRAVLVSMAKNFDSFNYNGANMTWRAGEHCSALDEDIQIFRRLFQRFPSRLKALRYEDGAMRPHEYARNIYSFLGLNFTKEVQDLVTSLTSAELDRYHPEWHIHRSDPVAAMSKWRHHTDYQTVASVDKNCSHVYPALGYRELTQEDMESNKTTLTQPDTLIGLF